MREWRLAWQEIKIYIIVVSFRLYLHVTYFFAAIILLKVCWIRLYSLPNCYYFNIEKSMIALRRIKPLIGTQQIYYKYVILRERIM